MCKKLLAAKEATREEKCEGREQPDPPERASSERRNGERENTHTQ